MCLCGMLAADYATLPTPMRTRVVRLLRRQRGLARSTCWRRARADAAFGSRAAPRDAARTLLAGLEGAMLLARPYGDLKRFRSAAALLLDGLTVDR